MAHGGERYINKRLAVAHVGWVSALSHLAPLWPPGEDEENSYSMCYSEPLITPSATEPLCYSSVTACDTAWRYSSDTARYSECDVTPEL